MNQSIGLVLLVLVGFAFADVESELPTRDKKILPIFQVVTFPNDACDGDSTRNGR